jgi:hypothetical protein
MSISSVNEIPVEIAPFGDPELGNFSPWGWRWSRKFTRNKFGDGDDISSSASLTSLPLGERKRERERNILIRKKNKS